MRGLFEILSVFDWITPSIGFISDVINDPTPLQTHSWTFFVPYDYALTSGWNAVDIEQMLQQYGIKTWGGQITNGEFFFSVKRDQAQWAEYLLLRNGIPLQEISLGAPRPNHSRGLKTSRKSKKQANVSLLDQVDNFLDNLF